MEKKTLTKNQKNDTCFCCGKSNSEGLSMEFALSEGSVYSDLVIPRHFSGWKTMTHGGFLAMLLDEVMAQACSMEGFNGVTAKLEIRYHKPVNTCSKIRILGTIQKSTSRTMETSGVIQNETGEKVASGKAVFFRPA